MPINAATVIAIIGLFLALAVYVKTRRIGPTVAVVVGAFVVMAISDPALITAGGAKVGQGFTWAMATLLKF